MNLNELQVQLPIPKELGVDRPRVLWELGLGSWGLTRACLNTGLEVGDVAHMTTVPASFFKHRGVRVEVTGLNKNYRMGPEEVHALRETDWQIEKGRPSRSWARAAAARRRC